MAPCPPSLTHMQAPAGTALSCRPVLFLKRSLFSKRLCSAQWTALFNNHHACTCFDASRSLCVLGLATTAWAAWVPGSLNAGPSVIRIPAGAPGLQPAGPQRSALQSLAVGQRSVGAFIFSSTKWDELPYFSDYNMPLFPKFGRKTGVHLIVRM